MRFELKDYHRNVSNEELINDVLRVKMIYGKDTLTRTEYKRHGKYGNNTFLRHFGGWNNVLRACGLRVNAQQQSASKASHHHVHVTNIDEQLINDLLRVSQIIRKASFSSEAYRKYGTWSLCTYYKHFGTWNNALKHAGLQPSPLFSAKIEDEKVLEEIERIWVKLGRQPTATDIRNGESIYSLNTFTRHFGGWKNALVAFIKYVNERDEQDTVADEQNPAITEIPLNQSLPKSALIVQDVETGDTQKHKTPREPNLRLRFKVLQRDQFRCCSCGASPAKDPGVELHVDHIFPWSKGGETVLENLQTLCSKCNGGKSDLT